MSENEPATLHLYNRHTKDVTSLDYQVTSGDPYSDYVILRLITAVQLSYKFSTKKGKIVDDLSLYCVPWELILILRKYVCVHSFEKCKYSANPTHPNMCLCLAWNFWFGVFLTLPTWMLTLIMRECGSESEGNGEDFVCWGSRVILSWLVWIDG